VRWIIGSSLKLRFLVVAVAAATLMAGDEVGDIFRDGKAYDVQVWSRPEARRSLTGPGALVLTGDLPGHEIEYPIAVVILGGLVTATLLNLFIVPSLYLRFGRRRSRPAPPAPTLPTP
jgi:Cu/Ag efflux pump CusA